MAPKDREKVEVGIFGGIIDSILAVATAFYFNLSVTMRGVLCALFAAGAVIGFGRALFLTLRDCRRTWRKEAGLCPYCGYNNKGLISATCPECGNAPTEQNGVAHE